MPKFVTIGYGDHAGYERTHPKTSATQFTPTTPR